MITVHKCPGEVHGPGPCEEVSTKKAGVPRVTDHVIAAPKSNRNFIHWNALSQMRAAPQERAEHKLVDQPNGSSQVVERSGLMPKYALKKVNCESIHDLYIVSLNTFSGFRANSVVSTEDENGSSRGGGSLGK